MSSPADGQRFRWRPLLLWRVLSALFLLAMGEIHLYRVFLGTGGVLGVLFVVNALGSLVLAVAIVSTRGKLLVASTLSLVFMAGTLLPLVITLTPAGLFGTRSSLDSQWVLTALLVESIGVVVLLVTTALAYRKGC